MSRSGRIVVASLAVLGATSVAVQSSAAPGPAWYTSPSGTYSLNTKPQDQYGTKGATYYFEKNEVLRWLDHRMYTLREVVVTDEGLIVGFAYRRGARKEVPIGTKVRVPGPVNPPQYLHVVILAANGNEILNEVTEQIHPPFRSTPPPPLVPYVEQLVVDSANDRVIVRLAGNGYQWRLYRLSTGESLDRFDPKERLGITKGSSHGTCLQLIPGTPLLLTHWCHTGKDYKEKGVSGRFILLDATYKPIWSFDALHDYAAKNFGQYGVNGATIRNYFREHPAIIISDESSRFAIRMFAENEEVSFSVKRTAGGAYEVMELKRTDIPKEGKESVEHVKPGH